MDSLATWVEAVDFRGHVPYQLPFVLSYMLVSIDRRCIIWRRTGLDELASTLTPLKGVAASSCLSEASLGVSGAGVEGFVTEELSSTCGNVGALPATDSSTLGGFVRARLDFRNGPIKEDDTRRFRSTQSERWVEMVVAE